MTATDQSNLKTAAAEVAKGTVRAQGSTVSWGYVIWAFFVDKLHWFVTPVKYPGHATVYQSNSLTFVVVGLLTAVFVSILRALERKWPWFSVMLLSQGAPTYSGPIGQEPDPNPVVSAEGDVNIGTVTVTQPPADANGNPAAPAVTIDGGAFAPDPNPIAPPPTSPPLFAPDLSGVPFDQLPPDTLSDVAQYAFAGHPAVEIVGEGVEDTNPFHGSNAPEEMAPHVGE